MKKKILLLFSIIIFTFPVASCFSQCVSYDVHACVDVIDYLHVKGNQMWWIHQGGGSNPGQHSSCSGDVLSVNGAPWGNWSTPFTLSGVTECMDMTSSVTQCSNVCALVQAPTGSNGWETIYKFDDSGPSAAHNYKINFTYCPTAIPPTLAFTVSSPACAGNNISFTYTGTASSTASYDWNFGDGTPPSTLQNPNHIYGNPGTYNVSLAITDCSVTTSPIVVAITVSTPPTSTFTATSPDCIGTNSTITYTGTGTVSDLYNWDFGLGAVVSGSGQGPYTVNWPSGGTKNITLTVDANGCFSPLKTDSVIISQTPISTFNVPSGKCLSGNSFNFIAGGDSSPNSTFSWTFANASPANSTLQNPVGIVFSTSGYHSVSMKFIKNGCVSNTYIDSVLIYPMPLANFSVADVCLNQAMNFNDLSTVSTAIILSWQWNFADNSPLGVSQNSIHTYTNSGSFPVSLITTTNNGCKDTIIKNAVVHPPPDAKFGTTNVCLGANTLFTNLSTIPSTDTIYVWAWNLGDDSLLYTSQNVSHLYAAIGSYTVQLMAVSNFGCIDSAAKISIVNPIPDVNFTSIDTAGCEPFCILFQNLSSVTTGLNAQWIWNAGDDSPIINSQSFEHCYANNFGVSPNSFNVTLTVTSDSGCVSTISKNNYITVYPNPTADFTVQPQTTNITDPAISITDLSVGAANWNWSFGDFTTSSISNPNPHSYADTGTYLVTLIASTQYNCSDTAYQSVSIEPDFVFYIPSAFTPNGDGMNDAFSGKGAFITEFKMNIFDRWGNMIFVSNDISNPWDGKENKSKDIALPDQYIYSISVIDFKSRIHNYKGTVTLLR
ncbi:MAG: PKD domain-containing protein [Bacteroidota bacterium]